MDLLTRSQFAEEFSWPHAPRHQLSSSGTYFLTAGTYKKQHFFRGPERLRVLHRGPLSVTNEFGWHLEAWAVFSNHYHFVAHSPENEPNAESLSPMLGKLHEKTGKWVNRLDASLERQVWHNFWETRLTCEKSYLARLNYVHQNPVKHVWCSSPTNIHGVQQPGLNEPQSSRK
jgi:putative transposase